MEFRKTRFEKHLEAVEREEERWGRGEGIELRHPADWRERRFYFS